MARSPGKEKQDVTGQNAGSAAVRVTAPARLHFGFLDLNGRLGRRFGGLGLALDRPATEVLVSPAKALSASGPEAARALEAARRVLESAALPAAYAIEVRRAIPAHAGLGSGTQLALAVGAALSRLGGAKDASRVLAELAGRGARSAIGIAAFDQGGFIVDGGRALGGTEPPPVIVRHPFPEDWRVLLVVDPSAIGVHGEAEAAAFAKLPRFDTCDAEHLCRVVLMRLLPALVECDMEAFGEAISEIQTQTGDYFASAQGGGRWSSPGVERIVTKLGKKGAVGLGQSSWGPTGFAFVESEDAAERLYQSVAEAARGEGLEVVIAHGRNSGARIEVLETADLGT